jgi:peptidoglycan/xylan/chitin deacetylase (PgdA/CDA1 family)
LDLESPDVRPKNAGASRQVLLHSVAGPTGSVLARWLERTPVSSYGELRPLVGPFPRPVVRISGPAALLEEAADSLPPGDARAEAVAVRLRRAGVDLAWGEPVVLADIAALIRLCRARGASSVELMRSDPSLLTEMQLGAFFHAYWRQRLVRRATCRLRVPRTGTRIPHLLLGVATDTAFWLGVRSVATNREWERLTRSSYVVFYYHRIAGDRKPGQEHLDVHPRRFEQHLSLLRRLGFRPLSPDELLEFHADPNATLPGRRYVLSADDGIQDAVEALRRHGRLNPQVFVCTSCIGGSAWWADDEPISSWDELGDLQAVGAVIASHSRGHTPLPELEPKALEDSLTGSLRDLEQHLPGYSPLLAYPHGRHDERVRSATAAAGYRAAFTTEPGCNGAGTDLYCLRRLGLKDWDGPTALVWKAVTGELLPWFWERWRRRVRTARAAFRLRRSGAAARRITAREDSTLCG